MFDGKTTRSCSSPAGAGRRSNISNVRLALAAGLLLGSLLSTMARLFWLIDVTTTTSMTPPLQSPMKSDCMETQLRQQTQTQQSFQKFIESTQTTPNCHHARILYKPEQDVIFDGFANEVQFFLKYLQIAVATNRVFVWSPNFVSAYAPKECADGAGNLLRCLWTPVSNCSVPRSSDSSAAHNRSQSSAAALPQPLGVGILNATAWSEYFDVEYYGPVRVVEVPPLIHLYRNTLSDVIPHYERQYGRFWVRAQMAHYWWDRSTDYLRQAIELRRPTTIPPAKRYIAFHVRMTDNVADLARDFGRNATVTRSFDRFMEIADMIRNDHQDVRHTYVATDNTDIADKLTEPSSGTSTSDAYAHEWTFHLQPDVRRGSSDSDFMWFRQYRAGSMGAIGADIETMRRADFLVGSFQSNVYRLAAELNVAYHASNYAWTGDNRIYTVDVEWYEDP